MSQFTPDETLLGSLAAEARHGYQLLECFHNPAQLGRVWHLSASQLYNVLERDINAVIWTGLLLVGMALATLLLSQWLSRKRDEAS